MRRIAYYCGKYALVGPALLYVAFLFAPNTIETVGQSIVSGVYPRKTSLFSATFPGYGVSVSICYSVIIDRLFVHSIFKIKGQTGHIYAFFEKLIVALFFAPFVAVCPLVYISSELSWENIGVRIGLYLYFLCMSLFFDGVLFRQLHVLNMSRE